MNRHLTFVGLRPIIIPSYTVYICFRNSKTVFIDTRMGLGGAMEVIRDAYHLKGDSVFFLKNLDEGIFTPDGLFTPFTGFIKRANKKKDVDKFIMDNLDDITRWHIRFVDGYAEEL